MNLIKKVISMFSKSNGNKPEDELSVNLAVALRRQESAAEKAREAMYEYKMSETLKEIAGRM